MSVFKAIINNVPESYTLSMQMLLYKQYGPDIQREPQKKTQFCI